MFVKIIGYIKISIKAFAIQFFLSFKRLAPKSYPKKAHGILQIRPKKSLFHRRFPSSLLLIMP